MHISLLGNGPILQTLHRELAAGEWQEQMAHILLAILAIWSILLLTALIAEIRNCRLCISHRRRIKLQHRKLKSLVPLASVRNGEL